MKLNKKLELLSLAVFNHSLDATVFRVVQVDGHRVGVVDTTFTGGNIQWVDKSSILPLSVGQLAKFNA